MKHIPNTKKKNTLQIIGIATICILIFLTFKNIDALSSFISRCIKTISPLLIGFMIALILNVPMKFFEAHLWIKTKNRFLKKSRRLVAFIISFVLIIGILTGVFCLVIPELIGAAKVIVQSATELIEKIQKIESLEIAGFSFDTFLENADWNNMISKIQLWLKDKSGSIVNTALSTAVSVIGGVMNFFIALVFSIYILFGKEKLKNQASRIIKVWFPEKANDFIIHVSSIANKNLRNFISGQTLEAVILGFLCMFGMIILRIPYAPMISTLVGITALIPVVGGLIGAGVGAFMILTVSPVKSMIFIIYLIILQQIEGNIIYPKVMGSKVNLPAIWILAAVTIGGAVGGVWGMFLSVPITSTIYVIIKEETIKRETSKNIEQKVSDESTEDNDNKDNSNSSKAKEK